MHLLAILFIPFFCVGFSLFVVICMGKFGRMETTATPTEGVNKDSGVRHGGEAPTS